MAVVDIIEFLLMALEVTGKFKGKNFHLQKKDESFTWRSSYSWSYVYFLQCKQLDYLEIIIISAWAELGRLYFSLLVNGIKKMHNH